MISNGVCKCVCHRFPDHGRLQDALEALEWHQERYAKLRDSAERNHWLIERLERLVTAWLDADRRAKHSAFAVCARELQHLQQQRGPKK